MTDRMGAECKDCGHVWVVAYLPMEMSLCVKVTTAMSKHCPKCGSTKPKAVAKTATLPPVFDKLLRACGYTPDNESRGEPS